MFSDDDIYFVRAINFASQRSVVLFRINPLKYPVNCRITTLLPINYAFYSKLQQSSFKVKLPVRTVEMSRPRLCLPEDSKRRLYVGVIFSRVRK